MSESSRKPIEVLYEDDVAIVFNKPAGLLVIPAANDDTFTLDDIVNRDLDAGFRAKGVEPPYHLHPCHRLDRDTSGVILFAKGKKNQQALMEQFQALKIKKKYIAFVHGKMAARQGELKSHIKDAYQNKYARRSEGKLAITRYKVLEQRKKFSIIEVEPVTGRTNQIRIHFSEAGHPLVGEHRYAFRKDFELKFKRTALHAAQLQWIHPGTKKPIAVEAPLPSDLEQFLARNQT